jgi:DNA-binding CsgD family transcriptional regulator
VQGTNFLLQSAASLGAVADVTRSVLPALSQATHSSLVFLYEAGPQSVTVHGESGAAELVDEYFRDYVATCPLHKIKLQADGAVVATTRHAVETDYVRSAVYNDFFRRHDFEHHLAVRLLPMSAACGEVGLMLNRGRKQREFTDAEIREVRNVLPSLTAAVRVARELDRAQCRARELEALVAAMGDDVPKVVLDPDGHVVFAHSPTGGLDVSPFVTLLCDPHHPIRASAEALFGRRNGATVQLSHRVRLPDGTSFRAELSICPGLYLGRPLVVVRWSPTSSSIPPAWSRFGLSPAEAAILAELVAGGSNLEIGARLFISPETVRTHLTRIFKKMGVRSRLDAVVIALRAQGRSVEAE